MNNDALDNEVFVTLRGSEIDASIFETLLGTALKEVAGSGTWSITGPYADERLLVGIEFDHEFNGDREEAVRKAFDMARDAKPKVLDFDI